jgi:ribosomal protein S18 acetylase RimI-like enzyme
MISIRKANPADTLLLAGIGKQTFLESHGHSAPAADIEAYVSKTYAITTVEDELKDPENIFHILYHQNRAIGYSKIIFNRPHPLINDSAVTKLERFYLLEEFHDRKLGLTLLEFIVSSSRKENQQGIWLYTWIKNQRAIRFYKKNGFIIIGSADFQLSATHSNPNHVMYLEY